MVSLAAANDLELHSVDIEQAFTQDDKLPFSPRDLHKTMDACFKIEGFDFIFFEESVWRRPAGGDSGMRTISMCQRTWVIAL